MSEIRITLETLYDILRNEKKREELQELEKTFFRDVVAYVQEKQSLLKNKGEENELFALGEQQKLEYELRSIKRILKEIYEKREKKIIDIALNRSRTGSDIIDTSSMLPEERAFYLHILERLDLYRRGVLLRLFQAQYPDIQQQPVPQPPKQPITNTPKPRPNGLDKTRVRFLHPIPSFVWKDMKVYGPFQKGDETEIFPEVAALLIRKGRAEKA